MTSPGADSRRGELATVMSVLDEMALAVHRIELPGTLDGGDVLTAVTALPDGTIIGRSDNLEDPLVFPDFLDVPEEHGTAVVDLGDGALLMSADAPQTAELLRARGFDVDVVEITEFEKLEGCVTCLSVRIRDAP